MPGTFSLLLRFVQAQFRNGGLGTRVKLLDRVGESPHQKGGTDRQTNKHKEFGES